MKREFHGYYKPSNEELEVVWNESIIAVDANLLLNLYTYSLTTSHEILALLGEFGERLWVPYQVSLEYHRNRCGIILKESDQYGIIAKSLANVRTALRARRRHPYITSELAARFEDLEAQIQEELAEGASKHRDLITTDSICDKVTELLGGRVGASMTEEVLGQLYKEGATRYTRKIPPGFSDVKKPEPDRYGDLILWFQLIQHAKTSKRPVIFVTDDLKEDWWAFAGNRRIGPRPELRHEFRIKTEHDIYIYSSDAFIKTVKERGKRLSESATEEIESASRERQQCAAEERTPKKLPRDPLEQFLGQEEMVERLTRDPLEQFLRREEMLERLTRDPLEQFRKRQEMLERLTRDPLEQYRKTQDRLPRSEYDEDEPDEPQFGEEQQDDDE